MVKIELKDLSFKNMIGEGAFGEVYKAKWQGSDVAVKKYKESAAVDFEEVKKELETLDGLEHPNVVTLYGSCAGQSCLCLVMEYANGGSLEDYIHKDSKKYKRVTLSERKDLLLQFASGLSYIHKRGVIHRDLKPDNLLLFSSAHGKVLKIGDFGLGRDLASSMT